jgi:N-acetylneuraminate synthase
MQKTFTFDDLFIYDLANNHQGDVEHAAAIVRAFGKTSADAGVRAAL